MNVTNNSNAKLPKGSLDGIDLESFALLKTQPTNLSRSHIKSNSKNKTQKGSKQNINDGPKSRKASYIPKEIKGKSMLSRFVDSVAKHTRTVYSY